MRPRLRSPLLLVVDVEVEPALFDWRAISAEPVLLPTGAAMAREERKAARRMVVRILAFGDGRQTAKCFGGVFVEGDGRVESE